MTERRGPGRPVDQESIDRKRQALLEATKTALVEKGLPGLSINAVAETAGEYKDAVRHYFGNKAGLVSALVEYLAPPLMLASIELPKDERLRALLADWRGFWADRDNVVAFVEILPLVARDATLREQMVARYHDYGPLDTRLFEMVGDADDDLRRAFSVLLSAVLDGVAQQALIDPEGVDVDAAFSLFADMVEAYAAVREGSRSGPEATGIE